MSDTTKRVNEFGLDIETDTSNPKKPRFALVNLYDRSLVIEYPNMEDVEKWVTDVAGAIGATVRRSGRYESDCAHERIITTTKGTVFPPCPKCHGAVHWTPLAAPAIGNLDA